MTSIIFLGTPNFGATVLKGLIDSDYEIKAVVTQPDKKVGRKQKITASPVKELALANNLNVFQPEKLSKSDDLTTLMDLNADLIVTAAYGQFLPTKFLNSAKIAAVNVHGSLLPKYRGGAPIQYALLNGDQETGITIMEMVKEMDAGDMFAQEKLTIDPEDTAGTLFEKMAKLGSELLLKTLPKIIAGECQKLPQDSSKAVFSPTISKAQAQIKTEMTASQARNLVRALNPDPGAFFMLNGERIKVWKAEIGQDHTSLEPGCLVDKKKRFAVSLADSTVLNLTEIQPMGKKRMSGAAYMNGKGASLPLGDKIIDD
ncbi:methionyl-tRNA formyltransferase [Lactobacillus psittaci]|uniref:Methionyl-tRNA formyltransferase n=1 Tax=Lactobacillus psittaci DSM 15354 TaxID=1122152 RepID=A0A0R1S402_9LACO|nr:methionyl-tRNA formyltransferase [Lactobacillus psittaci]KRL63974.1 methionyl-tRNA formyltransferase [Lactobacillus psittaci DSM 15354]